MPITHSNLGRAESITIEADSDGFELHIDTEYGSYIVNVHGVTKQLLEVGEVINAYWQEGKAAAAEHQRELDISLIEGTSFEDAADAWGGYDRDDPKHPQWHSTHADLWDSREGK